MSELLYSTNMKRDWQRDGYLILKNLIKQSKIDEILDEVESIKETAGEAEYNFSIDFLDGPKQGERFQYREVEPDHLKNYAFKINSAFMESKVIKDIC